MWPPGKLHNLRDREKLLLPLPHVLRNPQAGMLAGMSAPVPGEAADGQLNPRTFSPFCSRTVTLFSFCSCSNTK